MRNGVLSEIASIAVVSRLRVYAGSEGFCRIESTYGPLRESLRGSDGWFGMFSSLRISIYFNRNPTRDVHGSYLSYCLTLQPVTSMPAQIDPATGRCDRISDSRQRNDRNHVTSSWSCSIRSTIPTAYLVVLSLFMGRLCDVRLQVCGALLPKAPKTLPRR